MSTARPLPLHLATLLLGTASVPLAFAGHLVSLALVLALLALACRGGGWLMLRAQGAEAFTTRSLRLSRIGAWMALLGMTASLLVWWAYVEGWLPRLSGA